MLRLLLSYGARPNEECEWGSVSLMATKSIKIAKLLLRTGAKINGGNYFTKDTILTQNLADLKRLKDDWKNRKKWQAKRVGKSFLQRSL